MRDSAYNSTIKRARALATIAASPRCEDCGATTDLTADHLIPVIDGGSNAPAPHALPLMQLTTGIENLSSTEESPQQETKN